MTSTTTAPDGAPVDTEATTDEADLTRTELRSALHNLARLTGQFSMDLNARVDREAVRVFAEPWLAAAEERRRGASGSPSDEARWRMIISDMQRPEGEADLLSLTFAARGLLRALLEALRLGPSVVDVADHVRASIASGAYPQGSSLSAGRIATELECPRASLGRVQLALADLEAEGLVTFPQRNRARVAGEEGEQQDRVVQTTDWLRLLIQAGVYPPLATLPTRRVLGRLFVTPTLIVTQALRALDEERAITAYRGTRARVRPVLPFEAMGPPDLDVLLPRLEAVAAPDADLRSICIRETCRRSHIWWHSRFTPHPETLRHTVRVLAAAAAHLLPRAAHRYPDDREVHVLLRLTAVTALAELPQDSDRRVWRAACLGAAVSEVLGLLPDAV